MFVPSVTDVNGVRTQVPEVDCGVDCVGFEARGCGHNHGKEVPAQVKRPELHF